MFYLFIIFFRGGGRGPKIFCIVSELNYSRHNMDALDCSWNKSILFQHLWNLSTVWLKGIVCAGINGYSLGKKGSRYLDKGIYQLGNVPFVILYCVVSLSHFNYTQMVTWSDTPTKVLAKDF